MAVREIYNCRLILKAGFKSTYRKFFKLWTQTACTTPTEISWSCVNVSEGKGHLNKAI